MGLSRELAIQDRPGPSSSRSQRIWSGRFSRQKNEVGDLVLKHKEQSQGTAMASNGSPPQSSQKTVPARLAPLATPPALPNLQDRCPLFKLPRELRIVIYELFLQKSRVLVAEDRACSGIFRQNSRLMAPQKADSQGSGTLRLAHFYQDDDDPIIWCSRTPDSQNRPYERDSLGELIIKPYSANLMSSCIRICDEMAPVLYGRKTLVLALSSLLLNIKEEYFSTYSFAQIQHLHINLSWGEGDDSWIWETIEKMNLHSLTVFIDISESQARQPAHLEAILPRIVPIESIRSIPEVQIKFEHCASPLSRVYSQFDAEAMRRIWGGNMYSCERKIQYGHLV